MLNPVYNLIFIAIIIFWVLFHYPGRQRITDFISRHRRIVLVSVWLLFVCMLSIFILFFDVFVEAHDIDNAVEGAAGHLLDGGNPYRDAVAPRFADSDYGHPREMANGTYNYLPLDLFIYSGMRELLLPLGDPIWFVVANAIFASIASFLFWMVGRFNPMYFFPLAGSAFIFFSFDNVCLTSLFIAAGLIFLYRPDRTDGNLLIALLFLGLASLTKIFAVIILLVIVITLLQAAISARKYRFAISVFLCLIALLSFSILIALPFGISQVLDSTIFFHSDPAMRLDTSMGGTLLYELLGAFESYSLLAMGLVLLGLIVSLRLPELLDRVIVAESIFLAVMIKSSYSALLPPAMFLFLGYFAIRLRIDALLTSGDIPDRSS